MDLRRCHSPVDEDGLDLVTSVSDVHPSDHEPIHVGTDAVQVDLHVERGPGLHPQLVINQGPRLSHANTKDRSGSVSLHLLNIPNVVDNPEEMIKLFAISDCCGSLLVQQHKSRWL